MKSRVNYIEEKKEEFPMLMKDIDSDLIVLMQSDCSGLVVATASHMEYKIGDYSRNFCLDCFERFSGEVILSN